MFNLSLMPLFLFGYTGKTKNPAYLPVSRVGKTYFDSLPAYTCSIRITLSTLADGGDG
jgi:hypothetical protein